MRLSKETVSLVPVRADLLAQKLASAAGYQLSLTENGRRVHHRIRLLGGVTEDSLANQPAVRAVVRQVLQSPYGAKTESLVATAGKNMSRWPGNSRRRRGYKDYPAQVIGTLAERGILQPLACLKCPSCASTIRVTPSELGAPVRCELCSASVPFGSYIANSPERPAAWAILDLRPVYHRLEQRIRAHVLLCWLALLLIRIAETSTGQTWPAIRRELDRIHLGTFTGPAGTFRKRTELSKPARDLFGQLAITPPRQIHELAAPDAR